MKSLLALASALALSAHPQDGGAALGAVPRFEFERPLFNARGVKCLDDLRGRVAIVEFWGASTWGAPQYVGDLLTLKQQWGDDLELLFLEMQGSTEQQVQATVLKYKWITAPVMWSSEPAIRTDMIAVPQLYLLSSEGEILMKLEAPTFGLPLENRDMDALEERVAAAVRPLRQGPEGTPKEVARAWQLISKGELAKAFAAARALAEAGGEEAAAAEAALAFFRRRVSIRLDRADWMAAEGRLAELERELEELAGGLEGEPELLARWQALATLLEAEEQAAEREAARELDKLLEKLAKQGPKAPLVKALAKLAREHAGTRSGARAAQLEALTAVELR